MSLLKKASIITTPTAYAEDYLYSIKPAYQVSDTELVTNGNFDTDSDWTKGSSWTISGGAAHSDGGTASTLSSTPLPSLVVGKKYKTTYTIKNRVSGSTGINATTSFYGLNNTDVYHSENGTYEVIAECANASGDIRFYSNNFNGSIDNVSVREVTEADFDFDRNSTGTRVNEDYLIEDVPYNLLRYTEAISTDFGVTDVTLTDNYSLSASGTQTSTRAQLTNLGQSRAFNTITSSVVSGQSYTFSCHYKGTQGQTVYINALPVGGTEVSKAITLNGGWQRESVTFTAGSSSNYVYFVDSRKGGTATDFEVWGAQLVKGDQPKDYLKTTDRLDIPRIDYTNGEPSILLEPQSTNLLINSTNFSGSNWSNFQSSITSNQNNALTNLNDATLFYPTISSTYASLYDPTNTTNGIFTRSVFAKANGKDFLCIDDAVGGKNWFNLSKGTIGTVNSGYNAEIVSYGGGWYRCSVTNKFNATYNYLVIYLVTDADNSTTITANGTDGILLFGGQTEQKGYATSLIHTSGSTVTRSADAANNAGNSDLFNDSEGVLYAEIKALANDGTFREITLNDGTVNNVVELRYNNVDNQIQFVIRDGGSVTVNSQIAFSNVLEYNKIAFQYKANDFKVFANGSEVATDTAGTVPSGLNKLDFSWAGNNNFYGNVKMVAVFKEALTDLELEKLTGYNNHELYMNYYNRLSYLGLVEEYNVESDINNYIL